MFDYPESLQKPLVPGGSSCVTAKLKDMRDGTFRFHPVTGIYIILPAFLFCLAGLFLFLPEIAAPNEARVIFYLGAAILLIGGFCIVFASRKQAVFDFNRKCYWKDRRRLRMGENPERMKDYLPFKRIESLQIITERCRGNKGAVWFSYELNIVCLDGTRYNVIDHGGLDQIRMDGRQLADKLGVPLHEVKYRSEDNARSLRKKNIKAMLIIACCFSVIAVLAIACTVIPPLVQYCRAKSWVQTPAFIHKCYVDQYTTRSKHGRKTHYFIHVSYGYTWKGREYTGNNFDTGGARSSTEYHANMRRMKRIVRQYPQGAQVTCYVNPAKPSQAMMRRDLPVSYMEDCLKTGFLFIFPIVGFIIYFRLKRKDQNMRDEA